MATRPSGDVLRHLRALFDVGVVRDSTDGELLECFMTRDGEAAEFAFATLVGRHGPMVLRVCRQALDDPADVDDAFQATFLILIRKAGSVRRRDSLASWLHGVALRVAGVARKSAVRRRWHELRASRRSEVSRDPTDFEDVADLGRVLHEELARLPERFRAPLVLCHLEGRGCEEAAQALGWPLGTVKSRLSRGRDRLRARLIRRGLAPSLAMSWALAAEKAGASVPAALARATTSSALRFVAGQTMAGGVVSPAVAGLVNGVVKIMVTKPLVQAAAGAVLALGIATVGAGALPRAQNPEPAATTNPPPPSRELSRRLSPDYVVEPPDLIRIETRESLKDLPITGERLVRPDGKISLGYYGELYVAGLTTREIKEKVVRSLRKHLSDRQLGLVATDPDRPGEMRAFDPGETAGVSVEVAAWNSKFYYVQGMVGSPGKFPYTGNETVLDAICHAGGLVPGAEKLVVRLVRPAPPGSTRETVFPVDIDGIVQKGDTATNYQLFTGDRVLVTRKAKPEAADRPNPTVASPEFQALERRILRLEEKMDRMIELLRGGGGGGGAAVPRPARQ